jgi:hypothetical protein
MTANVQLPPPHQKEAKTLDLSQGASSEDELIGGKPAVVK